MQMPYQHPYGYMPMAHPHMQPMMYAPPYGGPVFMNHPYGPNAASHSSHKFSRVVENAHYHAEARVSTEVDRNSQRNLKQERHSKPHSESEFDEAPK